MQVLYYNIFTVPSLIQKGSKAVEPYLSKHFSEELFNKYRKFGMDRGNMVYDRSGILPHYINIKSDLHPIPKVESFNKSFEDVVRERSLELLSRNKKIKVIWSGGIDSTLALFALMHYANDLSQISVVGTYGSILESGSMFDKCIKNKVSYDININTKYMIDSDDSIFVTGMMGNQLFGPTNEHSNNGTEKVTRFQHIIGSIDTMYEPYDRVLPEDLLEFLKPCIEASQRKIETIFDLRWYCNFNFDWYTNDFELTQKLPYNVTEHFFNTVDFQKYVLTTKDPFVKIPNDPLTHRWVMRDLIAEYSGDINYARNKKKGTSTFAIVNPTWSFLLENHTRVLV